MMPADEKVDGTHLSKIRSRETVGVLCKVGQIDIGGNRRVLQGRLHDGFSRRLVGERNVDQRVQTTGSHEGRVESLGSIWGRN